MEHGGDRWKQLEINCQLWNWVAPDPAGLDEPRSGQHSQAVPPILAVSSSSSTPTRVGDMVNLSNSRTDDALTENEFAQYGCLQSGSVVESRASKFSGSEVSSISFLKPRAHVSRRDVERGRRNERFIRLPGV